MQSKDPNSSPSAVISIKTLDRRNSSMTVPSIPLDIYWEEGYIICCSRDGGMLGGIYG